jgi:anti-anti-sigma factor
VGSSDTPSGRIPDSGRLEIERLGSRVALLVPAGGLAGDQLHNALREGMEALVAEGVTGMVIDMRSFSVLDSSGLGALVSCHGDVSGIEGVRLVLTGVSPSLRRTLSRAMLLQVLPVYESVERAFAALRS